MTTDCSAPANSAQEQNVWCEKKPTRSILDLQVTLTPVSVRVYMSTIRTREHRFEASKEGGTWKLNIRAKWKFAKYVKAAQNVWIMSSDGQIKYRVVRLHEWCTGRTRKSSNTIQPMKICMKERLKIPATNVGDCWTVVQKNTIIFLCKTSFDHIDLIYSIYKLPKRPEK